MKNELEIRALAGNVSMALSTLRSGLRCVPDLTRSRKVRVSAANAHDHLGIAMEQLSAILDYLDEKAGGAF